MVSVHTVGAWTARKHRLDLTKDVCKELTLLMNHASHSRIGLVLIGLLVDKRSAGTPGATQMSLLSNFNNAHLSDS